LPTPGRVAVLADSTLHGREFREGVVEFVNKTPSRRTAYSLVFDEALEPGQADFAPVLGRLGSANADIFLADTSLSDFLSLHRQYIALGLCHKVTSYGAHGSELNAFEALGFDKLSYVLSAVWWSSRLAPRGLNAQFVEAFKETFHREPEWYGAL